MPFFIKEVFKIAKKTNITINDHNYFRVTATVGFDSTGKRIRKTFYGESKKDAESKRDEYINGIKQGLMIEHDKLTFGALFETWFNDVHKPSIKDSSYSRYEVTYRLRIKSSDFCTMLLKDIKSIHIQRRYKEIYEEKGYNIVWNTHKLLNTFFYYCVDEGYLSKNPLKQVTIPKNKEDKRDKRTETKKVLSKSDMNEIINKVNEDNKFLIFLFAFLTGLREGEIIALTYRDVDLKNGIVHVNKSAKINKLFNTDGTTEYKLQILDPKNDYSIREVPLLKKLVKFLEVHKEKEKNKLDNLGIKITPDTPFFTSSVGKYIDARVLLRQWVKLCDNLKIEYIKFHGLRTTFVTNLARNGVPLKTASVLAGHSDIKITAEIYNIVESEDKQKAISTLKNVFD